MEKAIVMTTTDASFAIKKTRNETTKKYIMPLNTTNSLSSTNKLIDHMHD